MGRIFGIKDQSRRLDHWDLILVPPLAGVFIWLMFTDRGHWFLLAVAGAYVALVLVVMFMVWRMRRPPFHRVATLLGAGRVEEAVQLGEQRLERVPEDAVTRLNLCSALFAAGRSDDARRTLAVLSQDHLPEVSRPLFDSMVERLKGPS